MVFDRNKNFEFIKSEMPPIGIIKYFERRGYYEYLMDRPESTHTDSSRKQKTKGIPGSGEAVINAQAEITQAYIYDHVGYNYEKEKI